eukprot:7867195-Heterocapsa_arctica.AAC.1
MSAAQHQRGQYGADDLEPERRRKGCVRVPRRRGGRQPLRAAEAPKTCRPGQLHRISPERNHCERAGPALDDAGAA